MSVLSDLEVHLTPMIFERDYLPTGAVSCDACSADFPVSILLEYDLTSHKTERIETNLQDFWAICARRQVVTPDGVYHPMNLVDILCDHCASCCDDCGEIVDNDSINDTAYGDRICDDCRENYYFSCDFCEGLVHSDDINSIDGGNSYYCRGCTENRAYWCNACDDYHRDHYNCPEDDYPTDRGLIKSYSYKPEPVFYSDGVNQKLFFGLELEIESTSGNYAEGAQLVTDRLGDFVYLKEDGSLNHGFEIVTHPFDYEHYRSNFNFGFLADLRALGFRSWDSKTCGLHIHISKTGFISGGHIWRFSNLILNNLPQWVKIAGRNSERWASFDKGANKIAGILKGKEYPERYVAVNMSNDKTIEVRIFRGSLNERRVCAAIESIHAAVVYTKNLSVRDVADKALSFDRFAQWVEGVAEYGNLCDLLIAKNIIHKSAQAEERS
jgi:hypothetical protein